ncbi:hypothetical protein K503DRAFT_848096 [Rhizopogon vinicolor AM-OR11-026]|uniref:L-ornithine N(5)-monooxygenase [NAD(P)H] n=1 Tax=Rhizopogon vinicolor AM-OR11-026 TaxID=1314800 RepID=A0A1B7NAU1_9AGAM|nr:hypothetical protein K503DRAFT_848096 [Rhizopogon vinicolor AM-OR11-026]
MVQPPVYTAIGLGFGPANIAVAGALLEQHRETQRNSSVSANKFLFIERHHEFRWHPGMLLPGARMQISFLKDLATLRSPQSPITFVAYLHSQNRLVDFINRGNTTPTRKEYSDYLAWAAKYVQDQGIVVAYGENVTAIKEEDEGTVQIHSTVLATGETRIRLARNLIISPGGSPRIPRSIQAILPHPRIIHSSSYLSSVKPMLAMTEKTNRSLRIAVLGSGQSAAEILLDLHQRLTSMGISAGQVHDLHLIIRGGSLKPSDDSPFANEIFNPESTDAIYNLPSDSVRRRVIADCQNTNYGVVNSRTLDSLYEVVYDQKVEDGIARRKGNTLPGSGARITIIPYSNLLSAEISTHSSQTSAGADAFSLALQNTLTRDVSETTYDAIVCATGYERHSWLNLLKSSGIGKHFGLSLASDKTRLSVERNMGEAVNGEINKSRALELRLKTVEDLEDIPYTSSESDDSSSTSLSEFSATDTLYVSRRYRLIPLPTTDRGFVPRIYLQGCTEETHGLSDTLLSVLGVRAGEVVEDLCSNY